MVKSKAAEKFTDLQIKDILYDYFNKQMKPYAINDILNNLNLTSNRKQVLISLDHLTESGKLVSKKFGKSTVWVIALNKDDNNQEEFSLNKLKDDLHVINEKISQVTSTKNSFLAKKQKFSQFIQDPDELKTALMSIQTSIEKKSLLKTAIMKKIETIKVSKTNQDVDSKQINKMIKQIKKKIKILIGIEKTLSDMILFCVPSLKKSNLKDFLIDEIGYEQVTIQL
ncbi:hypothetical protein FOG50_00080 [Hanseniaspora uvarum]|nr:hypothetical protein FOG48_01119 [Hanseniaspora uvarum]KAF0279066.1 hypothetical protein FOG50_00080 [Hanseniaspora uvarum]